jgi:hypothetical protein
MRKIALLYLKLQFNNTTLHNVEFHNFICTPRQIKDDEIGVIRNKHWGSDKCMQNSSRKA